MKVIERKASDNKYLHRDFHISMNMMMGYICENFGTETLTQYLSEFSRNFHGSRTRCLKEGNLRCLEEYFIDIYKKEEWPVDIKLENDILSIRQKTCPGISHIKNEGFEPIGQYVETYSTVYETMCLGTPYEYFLERYDPETGACEQRFERRNRE